MQTRLRLALGFARIGLNVVVGLLIVALYFPFASMRRRTALIAWWARGVLRICGVTLQIEGVPLNNGTMQVFNHVSWLDIYSVNAVAPVRFVAKSEIRSWPVFGYLAAQTGTLFLERGRRHAVHRANGVVANILREGGRVGVFPEGTTGDGTLLLPFHANLIQAAVDAAAPVQPVALCYRDANGKPSTAVAFVGDMTLLESMRLTLLAGPLTVHLAFLAPIDSAGRTRHALAQQARAAIGASLGLHVKAEESPAVAGTAPETAPDLQAAPH